MTCLWKMVVKYLFGHCHPQEGRTGQATADSQPDEERQGD